jgi:hypothetical protein
MTFDALIDEVHALGAELVVIGGVVKLIGDRSRITPDLRAELHAARDALFLYLRSHPCTGCGQHAFPQPGAICFWCRYPDARRRGAAGQR